MPSRPGSRKDRTPPPRGARGRPPSPTILLSVAGLSPQVVTETLYCLLVASNPPVDVREVHLLTTRVGAGEARSRLLAPRTGWFHRFCRDYGIPRGRIRFSPACIHVPRSADGRPLADVRTPEDSARVADAVLALVRNLTRDPGLALHASVAGGRKTMGLFLGIAFQLFARPQDRLSHILVSPPDLEGHPEFFYPPPVHVSVTARGKTISTADARLELAEIPVLLLRDRVRPMGLEADSYSALILQGQRELDRLVAPPALSLDAGTRRLEVAETAVALTPVEFAVYRLLAERRCACRRPACPGCEVCALEAGDFDRPEVRARLGGLLEALGVRDERVRTLAGWRDGADKRFREVRARINAKIDKGVGTGRWVDPYRIATTGRRPDTRYYLPLPPELIGLR